MHQKNAFSQILFVTKLFWCYTHQVFFVRVAFNTFARIHWKCIMHKKALEREKYEEKPSDLYFFAKQLIELH